MTGFDLALVAIVAVSVLFAALRGFVRSAVSLLAWVVALLLALRLGPALAAALVEMKLPAPLPQILGYGLVFVGVAVAGALVGLLLARLLRAVGLGPIDRLLGAAFGLARGVLVVLIGVLLAGFTALPRSDWWQNSALTPLLSDAVLALRPYLPADWADRLDYSPAGRKPVTTAGAADWRRA